MAHGLRTSLLILLAAGVLGWALPRHILAGIGQGIQTISRRLSAEAVRRPRMVLLVVWLVALIPMIHHTLLVRHYSVNVPIFDDWAMAPLIVKAHLGQLTLADLFQQQQEARTFLPNLIFVLSAKTEWNVCNQIALSIVASWLTAAGLFILLRRSGLNLAAFAICFWLMVLALFSTAAYELWIFASGFPSFLPLLFLVAGLAVIGSRISIVWKFVICAVVAVASTFTLANGLLAWGLTFPVLMVSERVPRWRFWLAAWGIVTALAALVYFWGYEKPAYLPGFAPAVSLVEYVSFILQFLGGGLAYSRDHNAQTAATVFGLVQVALFMAAAGYGMRRPRDREFIAKTAPWFALALFAIGSAFLAALGRVGFGASYALASRYVPFSLGLTLGVIGLGAVVLTELLKRNASLPMRRWGLLAAAVLILGYLASHKVAAQNTRFFLRAYSANDRLAKTAVVFSRAIDTTAAIRKVVFPPAPDHVVRTAAALDDLHLLRPPLVRSNILSALPHEAADGTRVAGLCEVNTEQGELFHVSGWALLKERGRPADGVVIAYESPGAEPVMFAMSDSIEMRWDVARPTWPNDFLWS
ncbi:MAG TPA: hypothetical protein VF511_10430, partial [Chthoniobacterales bacterium]